TAKHFDRVVAADINSFVCRLSCSTHKEFQSCFKLPDYKISQLLNTHNTSGAKLTIFKNFFSRSSLATGPKTRVPTGSPASLISTAAFWSKRIYVPSRRRCSFRVRTMTAFTTVPFFVWPSGAASFTLAVTTSPKPARRPVAPPSGSIICSLRAPLLSATSSMLRIITVIRFLRAKHPLAGFQMPAIQDARLLLLDSGNHFRHQCGLPHDFL